MAPLKQRNQVQPTGTAPSLTWLINSQERSSRGSLQLSEKALGKGGEGSVYELKSAGGELPKAPENLVAKIYHKPTKELENKIGAMIENRPQTESAAWPIAAIYEGSTFRGFLMQKLSATSFKEWAVLSNAASRKEELPSFDFKYALASSANLGVALSSIHKAGHYLGDINESNIFVSSSARVMLVDTDSAQVQGAGGQLFRCAVGKAEYTAPELSEGSLRDKTRTDKSDSFAYAVAVFQMLTGGYLPTDGVYQGKEDPPNVRDKIRAGIYPSLKKERLFKAPPSFPKGDCLPKRISLTIEKCLQVDPARRATSSELLKVLKDVLSNLENCKKVKGHWYDKRDGHKVCPWCANLEKTGLDPWGKNRQSSEEQVSLSPLKFKKAKAPKKSLGSPFRSSSKAPGGAVKQKAASPQGQSGYAEPPKPELYKGKTVISLGGVKQARPRLATVFSSNFKLGLHCVNNETPWLMRFWWSKDQHSPHLGASLVGWLLSILLAFSFLAIPKLFEGFVDLSTSHAASNFVYGLILVSMGTAVACSTILLVSSLVYKRRQTTYNYRTINFFKNFSRYLIGPIFWGPVGVLLLLVLLVIAVINFLMEEFSKPQAGKRRF